MYDGEGPDAFFVVGNQPMRRDRIVIRDGRDAVPLPYASPYSTYSVYSRQSAPSQQLVARRYRYDDPDVPILGRFDGQDIELSLPEGMDTGNISWISLYCRQFDMDFGHVKIQQYNPWGGQPKRTQKY